MVIVATLDGWFGAPGQTIVGVGFPGAVNEVCGGRGVVRRGGGAAVVLPHADTMTASTASAARDLTRG